MTRIFIGPMDRKMLFPVKTTPDGVVKSALDDIARIPDVNRIICFPDVHLKQKYVIKDYKINIPSSVAVSSTSKLFPQLRTRGICCGMLLIRTNLKSGDLNTKIVRTIFRKMNKSLVYKALFKLDKLFFFDQHDFSSSEFRDVIVNGIDPIIHKYALDKSIKSAFLEGGRFKVDPDTLNDSLNNKWGTNNRRLRQYVGRNFMGNHFLEFQLDKEDQEIYALIHTAGDSLESSLKRDISEQFHRDHYVGFPEKSGMAKQIMTVHNTLMNYGFAYRLVAAQILRQAISDSLKEKIDFEYVKDSPHNLIRNEVIKGKRHWVYRHNATVLEKGSLAVIAGNYDAPSYVVRGCDTERYLNTIDHGMGTFLKSNRKPTSGLTFKFEYKNTLDLPGFRSEMAVRKINVAGRELLETFKEKNLVKKELELFPLYTLKYAK